MAYIALGANIDGPFGTPRQTLKAALVRLGDIGRIEAVSGFYETAPVGFLDQPVFLNAAVALLTDIQPEELLDCLLEIERALGRDRSHGVANGPRAVDLDLLLYGDQVVDTPTLQLPHPRMARRRFVLDPLVEIAPTFVHPVLRKSMKQLQNDLADSDRR